MADSPDPRRDDPHRAQRVMEGGAPLARAKAAVVMLHGRGASAESTDANRGFAAKLKDLAGLYVDPPKHAVVVDEKSQIQALDRTQPRLPLKPGKAGTHVGCGVPTAPQATHDYPRNGITTLSPPSTCSTAPCSGRCMQRHRHQEFLRFLNAI